MYEEKQRTSLLLCFSPGPKAGQKSRKQTLRSVLGFTTRQPLVSENELHAPKNDLTKGRRGDPPSSSMPVTPLPLALPSPSAATLPTVSQVAFSSRQVCSGYLSPGKGRRGMRVPEDALTPPSTGRTDDPFVPRAAKLFVGPEQQLFAMPSEKHLCKFITKSRTQ